MLHNARLNCKQINTTKNSYLFQVLALLYVPWGCDTCHVVFPNTVAACTICGSNRGTAYDDWVASERSGGKGWVCSQLQPFKYGAARDEGCKLVMPFATSIGLSALQQARIIPSSRDRCPMTDCGRLRTEALLGHVDTLAKVALTAIAVRTGMSPEYVRQAAMQGYSDLMRVDSFEKAELGVKTEHAHPIAKITILQWTEILAAQMFGFERVSLDLDQDQDGLAAYVAGLPGLAECRLRAIVGERFVPRLPKESAPTGTRPFGLLYAMLAVGSKTTDLAEMTKDKVQVAVNYAFMDAHKWHNALKYLTLGQSDIHGLSLLSISTAIAKSLAQADLDDFLNDVLRGNNFGWAKQKLYREWLTEMVMLRCERRNAEGKIAGGSRGGGCSRNSVASDMRGNGEVNDNVNVGNDKVGQSALVKASTVFVDNANLGDLAREGDADSNSNADNAVNPVETGPVINTRTDVPRDGRSDSQGNRQNVSLSSGVSNSPASTVTSSSVSTPPMSGDSSSTSCDVHKENDGVKDPLSHPSHLRTGGRAGHPARPPHVGGNQRGRGGPQECGQFRNPPPHPGRGRSVRPPQQPQRGQYAPRGRGLGHFPRNMAPPLSMSNKRQFWQQNLSTERDPRGPMGPVAEMGSSFGGNPGGLRAQSQLSVTRGRNELSQGLVNRSGGNGWNGGRGNSGRAGAMVPGHFPPQAAGHFNHASNSHSWSKRPRFMSNTSTQSSQSSSGFSSSRGAKSSRPTKKSQNRSLSNSERAMYARSERKALDRTLYGERLHREMLVTSAGQMQLHGTVNPDGLCLICPEGTVCSGGNVLVVGDATLAPLIRVENHLEEGTEFQLSFLLGTNLSPSDALAMFLQASTGREGILGQTCYSNDSDGVLGERESSRAEGFITKLWGKRVEHLIFIFSDSFADHSGRGRVGDFLNQVASLQTALVSCIPGLLATGVHYAAPILKSLQPTPREWSHHLLVRQWLRTSEISRYNGGALVPHICSDELADVGYSHQNPVDQEGPVSEDIFVTLPDNRDRNLQKQGIYSLLAPDSGRPRPTAISGVFEGNRTFTHAGAKLYLRELKVALSKVVNEIMQCKTSTPGSQNLSQPRFHFLSVGSSSDSGAGESSVNTRDSTNLESN